MQAEPGPVLIPEGKLTTQKVTILMGLRNGAPHLPAQLDSIAAQTHNNWHLMCSDDGSTDDTRAIVQRFAEHHPGRVTLVNGPKNGFSANFMKMIADLPQDSGYIALADQDDIWEPDKIARALSLLAGHPDPTLYSVRCWYWYPASDRRVASTLPARPPGFRNALIENIATGNATLLNPAAARLACAAAQRTGNVFAHDWWLYLLVTGVGGRIAFDPGPPGLLYRQHDGNAIGAGQTATAQVHRKIKVLQGAFSDRIKSNLTAMEAVQDLLTEENQQLLKAFAKARASGLLSRLSTLRQIGLYRQTALGNLGFWGAASLGRI